LYAGGPFLFKKQNMEHRFLDKSIQRREALNIHNPVQVERSDTQLGGGGMSEGKPARGTNGVGA
jgi:hypothetical protein